MLILVQLVLIKLLKGFAAKQINKEQRKEMSFWHCLTILLQANNLVFPDEKQAEEHFLAKYGEAAQLIGLEKEEEAQASPSKKLELQLAEAAKILGTQVLLDQEAIEDGTIPAP